MDEADLPPDQAEDLRRELESYFYEKELDLELSGVPIIQIQQHLEADFGDEAVVATYLKYVHKKSFYHFITSLMKNKFKPSIFETVVLFVIIFYLYQNFLISFRQAHLLDFYGMARSSIYVFPLLFLMNITLIIRLFLGKSVVQKAVAVLLFLILIPSIFQTRMLLKTPTHVQVSDQEMLENYEDYDYFINTGSFDSLGYRSEKYGYQFRIPEGWMAYMSDGSSAFWRHLNGNEDVQSFGPPYGSDSELIDVQVFDSQSAPDKEEGELWVDYYQRVYLKEKGIEYSFNQDYLNSDSTQWSEEDQYSFENFYPGYLKLELVEPVDMKQNIALYSFYNRLYVVYYNASNPVHDQIVSSPKDFFIPEGKMEWVAFDHSSCPFSLKIPITWIPFVIEGDYYGSSYGGSSIDINGIQDCEFSGFDIVTGEMVIFEHLKDSAIGTYFEERDVEIVRSGETMWQDLPAKRLLLQMPKGWFMGGFSVEINPGEWIVFVYNVSTAPYEVDSYILEVLSSLRIK